MTDYPVDRIPQLPVFVYGSLLPGEPNDYLWRQVAEAEHPAVLQGARLYDLGSYPAAIDVSGHAVRGVAVRLRSRVYRSILAELDSLEGFNPWSPLDASFRRRPRVIRLLNGLPAVAWVYVGIPGMVDGTTPFDSDWKAHQRTRLPMQVQGAERHAGSGD